MALDMPEMKKEKKKMKERFLAFVSIHSYCSGMDYRFQPIHALFHPRNSHVLYFIEQHIIDLEEKVVRPENL